MVYFLLVLMYRIIHFVPLNSTLDVIEIFERVVV